MSWCSIREYAERSGQAASTIRRNLQQGRLYGRKFGRSWYVFDEDPAPPTAPGMMSAVSAGGALPQLPAESASSLQGLLDFSSKALHHYLLMHDKLMAEKDLRLREKESRLKQMEQSVADLEGYVHMLEARLQMQDEPWKGNR